MARAYSLDLRERIVSAVTAGQSCRVVVATFQVSVARAVKWSRRYRATGSAAAHKVGGRRPYALQGCSDCGIKARINQTVYPCALLA